jgi:hypothetical protein
LSSPSLQFFDVGAVKKSHLPSGAKIMPDAVDSVQKIVR